MVFFTKQILDYSSRSNYFEIILLWAAFSSGPDFEDDDVDDEENKFDDLWQQLEDEKVKEEEEEGDLESNWSFLRNLIAHTQALNGHQ